jgi:hypothetical protein
LDSLVKKIHQPTEKNDLQKEIEDKDEDKNTTKLLDWDKVIYDIVQTNGHKISVKFSQISDIIGEEEWMDGEMNIDRNCDVLPIEYDPLIVMFVNINITITFFFF